jgi:hypothetical protein
MTGDAAARIQSSEARANGGGVQAGGFAARAQSAAAKNAIWWRWGAESCRGEKGK